MPDSTDWTHKALAVLTARTMDPESEGFSHRVSSEMVAGPDQPHRSLRLLSTLIAEIETDLNG